MNQFEKDESILGQFIGKKLTPKLSIQEYLVDLLGGLFPGILFLLAFLFSLLPPLFILASYYNGKSFSLFTFTNSFFESIKNTPSAIWIALFLLFLLLAYIIGHIFYRRDPKTPDRRSFQRLRRVMKRLIINEICRKEIKKWENVYLRQIKFIFLKLEMTINFSSTKYKELRNEFDKRLKQEYGCTSKEDCQFPYPYYKEYLEKRGLSHLKELAIWSNEGDFQRSKTFINTLKIRLKYYFPDKYGTITRNEAHIRLASSAWYVSGIAIYLGVLGGIVSFLAVFLKCDSKFDGEFLKFASHNLAAILIPLVIALSSGYLKHNISKFIHYQRLREVFYVLETSFTAFRAKGFNNIISPPFNKIKS